MTDTNEPKKFQRQSKVKKLVIPNDKLTKQVMHRPADKYAEMLTTGNPAAINEKIKGRDKVLTYYWLELIDGYADVTPMDEFDFDVLTVCISAQVAGCDGLTFNEIARLMAGGKSHNTNLSPSRKEKIFRAVERMMCTKIRVDFTQLFERKKYPDLPKSLTSPILPCQIVDGVTVNGQRDCTVVSFLKESPLLTIARAKGQLLTIPVEVLDVPKQNNTERVTTVKNYVTRRVYEAKTQKDGKMPPKIRCECLFENCGLAGTDNDKKRKARNAANDVMMNLQARGVIRSFEFEKVEGIYRAIKFQF